MSEPLITRALSILFFFRPQCRFKGPPLWNLTMDAQLFFSACLCSEKYRPTWHEHASPDQQRSLLIISTGFLLSVVVLSTLVDS
jgi:hypothetical protein